MKQIKIQDVVLDIKKIVEIDVEKQFIYIEQMKDGNWRFSYTKSLVPDNFKFTDMKFVDTNKP